jgi:probable lipoprotein NlpC
MDTEMFNKVVFNSNFKAIFFLLLIVFWASSCKVFRADKQSNANTHAHGESKLEEYNKLTKANELINLARNYTGVPYKSGGTSGDGMDCSGLIYKVCQTAGLSLPRISYQQAEIGFDITLPEIQIGDLVFFKTAKGSSKISHVGLVTDVSYPENITFIHASTSKGVREDNLNNNYWKKAFAKATRPFVF